MAVTEVMAVMAALSEQKVL
jgi:hypothetical protein